MTTHYTLWRQDNGQDVYDGDDLRAVHMALSKLIAEAGPKAFVNLHVFDGTEHTRTEAGTARGIAHEVSRLIERLPRLATGGELSLLEGQGIIGCDDGSHIAVFDKADGSKWVVIAWPHHGDPSRYPDHTRALRIDKNGALEDWAGGIEPPEPDDTPPVHEHHCENCGSIFECDDQECQGGVDVSGCADCMKEGGVS